MMKLSTSIRCLRSNLNSPSWLQLMKAFQWFISSVFYLARNNWRNLYGDGYLGLLTLSIETIQKKLCANSDHSVTQRRPIPFCSHCSLVDTLAGRWLYPMVRLGAIKLFFPSLFWDSPSKSFQRKRKTDIIEFMNHSSSCFTFQFRRKSSDWTNGWVKVECDWLRSCHNFDSFVRLS